MTLNEGMPNVYIFVDRRKVGGCDGLVIIDILDLCGLPSGSYKTFSDSYKDDPEFTELDRNTNYRKIVLVD